VLVIGYGSDLRGDDGAGRRAAEQIAARALPGVRVVSVTQLVPELAADLDDCRAVVFVDASAVDRDVTVRRLAPAAPDRRTSTRSPPAGSLALPLTHHLTPPRLLALAAALGSAPADAFVVTIPASDFALGDALSPETAAALPEAVDRVVALCGDLARRP
jgi:hydrogenase maturation protease